MGEQASKMVISGASGMVGSALSQEARRQGWEVVPMVRQRSAEGIYWSVEEEAIDVEGLEGADAVVHLAGKNIAGERWSEEHKREIRTSRVVGTTLVAEAIGAMKDAPKAFICASAVGFYGHQGQAWVDEESEAGEGFLAAVCQAWEEACEPAREVEETRVVNARFGMILAEEGGALEKMLLPFKMGIGGRLGDGRQYMSWVALEDVVRAILFAIEHKLEGPVNVTAPNPVTNRQFTKALGKALSRPTVLPVPSFGLKAVVGGEMAEEMLLHGQRVKPAVLEEAGFEFNQPELGPALAELVG